MNKGDPEFKVLSDIYEKTHKRPMLGEYKGRTKGTTCPTTTELLAKYGSRQALVDNFLELYHQLHGNVYVPDYLLGALVDRCRVRRQPTGSAYLRIITTDENQIDAMATYVYNYSVNVLRKEPISYEFRILDYDLILALENMRFFEEPPFISSMDFVRGYLDSHSAVREYGDVHPLIRLTISGPLVPQIHDFLVSLGASNTQVLFDGSQRMHVHAKSLRLIRQKLYPPGAVANARKKFQVYSI